MIDHYLLNCERYGGGELKENIVVEGMRLSILLEYHQIIKKIVEYVEKTGQFKLDHRKVFEEEITEE